MVAAAAVRDRGAARDRAVARVLAAAPVLAAAQRVLRAPIPASEIWEVPDPRDRAPTGRHHARVAQLPTGRRPALAAVSSHRPVDLASARIVQRRAPTGPQLRAVRAPVAISPRVLEGAVPPGWEAALARELDPALVALRSDLELDQARAAFLPRGLISVVRRAPELAHQESVRLESAPADQAHDLRRAIWVTSSEFKIRVDLAHSRPVQALEISAAGQEAFLESGIDRELVARVTALELAIDRASGIVPISADPALDPGLAAAEFSVPASTTVCVPTAPGSRVSAPTSATTT